MKFKKTKKFAQKINNLDDKRRILIENARDIYFNYGGEEAFNFLGNQDIIQMDDDDIADLLQEFEDEEIVERSISDAERRYDPSF